MKYKLWGGAFDSEQNDLAWSFGKSLSTDQTFCKEELEVTTAHVSMLVRVGILSRNDGEKLINALEEMLKNDGWLEDPEIADSEDIHAAVEQALFKKIGDLAKNVAVARSRNDQIATVIRLWTGRKISIVKKEIKSMQACILEVARKYQNTIMPSFTHLQPAQITTLGFHIMVYFWMLQRDGVRFEQAQKMTCHSPLGSGASVGSTLPIDRFQTAEHMGLGLPIPNTMDAVSDRDFIGDVLHACASVMIHLSRLSSELILWSTPQFGFVQLSDSVTTGSSLMPQKRNPDIAELIRGRTSKSFANWVTFATLMKGLPLAYNRDMQDDKPPLFDSLQLTYDALRLSREQIETAKFDIVRLNKAVDERGLLATDVAEKLVKKGMVFREAHHRVGRWLQGNDDPELKALLSTPEESLSSHRTFGGPAPEPFKEQMERAQTLFAEKGFINIA